MSVIEAVGLMLAGVFVILCALPALYLLFLAGLSFVPLRSPPEARPAGQLRFAILIPAHDEESTLPRTLSSVARLDYPADRVSVHVVADNCTDGSAAVAGQHGANVHERFDPERPGKGAALNWLAEQVLAERESLDAIVFVDADCELSPNFLSVMERHLRRDALLVQALYFVDRSDAQPIAMIRAVAFHLLGDLRARAYMALGVSVGLYGTGMCMARSLLERYRWDERSVTEDFDLHLRLVRDGYRVQFAAEAEARTAMPPGFGDAYSQSVRWERGRFDHFRLVAGLLLHGLMRHDRNAAVNGLDGLLPPITLLAGGAALGAMVGAAAGSQPVAVVGGVALLSCLAYVARGVMLARLPPRVVISIATWAPVYAVWRIIVLSRVALGAGRGEWSRTSRNADNEAVPARSRPGR